MNSILHAGLFVLTQSLHANYFSVSDIGFTEPHVQHSTACLCKRVKKNHNAYNNLKFD